MEINMFACFAMASLALFSVPLRAAKPEPPVLSHSGPWNINVSENGCLMSRPFGTGPDRIEIGFQPVFNLGSIEILVLTQDRRGAQREGTATVGLQPRNKMESGTYFSNKISKSPNRGTRITVSRAIWDSLGDTDVLSIEAAPVNIRAKLVRFAAAKAAFDKCERDLLASWGIDPAVQNAAKAATPKGDPAQAFSAGDYPRAAVLGGQIGRVVAILIVDATGSVSSCRISTRSWPALNEATCRNARTVKFNPGRDANGQAAPSIFVFPVRWSMPTS